MKTLTLIIVGFFVVATAHAASDRLARISNETGVAVARLQEQQAATGFGYGELENANLLANASGQSFDTIAARHQAGEGWGKIAQDYGFKFGDIVRAAHRADQANRHVRGGTRGRRGAQFAHDRDRSGEEFGRLGVDRSHGPFFKPIRRQNWQQRRRDETQN
jgi:hypothetical protein